MMDFRKFCTIFCSIVLSFMFLIGSLALYYINLYAESDSGSPSLLGDFANPFQIRREPINVLVLGGDKVNNNTDTMMLVNFNPKIGKISILSIPRDTKVKIRGSYSKINAAYPYGGSKLALETVGNLLNTKISYYVFVDTSSFRSVVDLLDGVDYDVPVDIDYDDPTQDLHIHLKKGLQRLDGIKSEQFMRFREYNNGRVNKFYDGGDLKRISAQQSFIKEFIRQKANLSYVPRIKDILPVVFKNIDTNITFNDISRELGNIRGIDIENVELFTLPGIPSGTTPWYYICSYKKTAEVMRSNFDTGDTITTWDDAKYSDYEYTAVSSGHLPPEPGQSQPNPSNAEADITSSGIEAP